MFSILLGFSAASVAQQMAPARQGMQQCQSPNVETKTCFSLTRVSQATPSTYRFDTEMLFDEVGPVIASERSLVTVRGSEVCQVMKADEGAGASFTSNGQPLSASDAAVYRARLRSNFAGLAGRRVCTRIVAEEDGSLTVAATLDGRRIPAGDYPMLWVKPEDGWKVGP